MALAKKYNCSAGEKEYLLIDRSQMSGKQFKVHFCARNDKEAIERLKSGSYPHSLWKRVK